MTQFVETPTKTFLAASALSPYLRVYITDATTSPPTVGLAGATDVAIGVVDRRALATGDPVTVRLINADGTRLMIASGSITGGNPVYAAASGKVASSGTVIEGRALETVNTNGDQIEVLSIANSDISTSISNTNAAAFEVDADATTPKIALQGQSAGTGNFTTTLKPEATLSADTYVIVPETTDGDVLMACTLAQTVPGIKTFTGGIILSGAVDLQLTGATGEPEILLTTNLADALSIKDGAGDLMVFDLTTGTQVITITPALTVTGLITSNGGITLSGAVDLKFTGTTGQSEIVITDNLADALSIKDATGGADLLTLTTTNGAEAVNISTMLRPYTVATPVAAAGTDHTNGGALSRATVQHISSDGATKGVVLPTGAPGDMIIVINDSGTAAEIYAALGGTINGAGANASMVVPASKGVWCFCVSADTWVMFDMTARASAS